MPDANASPWGFAGGPREFVDQEALQRARHKKAEDGTEVPVTKDRQSAMPEKKEVLRTGWRKSRPEQEAERLAQFHKWDQKLIAFVNNPFFDSAVGIVILLNCLAIGVEIDKCPNNDSIRFRGKGAESEGCPRSLLDVAEHLFTFVFLMEFLVHLRARGWRYFVSDPLNLFDALLVWVTGVLLVWVVQPLRLGGFDASRFRAVTILRALRLLRLARVVKYVPQFREMWLLIRGLADSTRTLLWTAVAMGFVCFLFATLMLMVLADNPKYLDMQVAFDQCSVLHNSTFCERYHPEPVLVKRYFHNLAMTMFSLLQIMTGDSWAEAIVRPSEDLQTYTWIPFVAFVSIGSLVLLNLVTAVIVNNALTITNEDKELKLRNKKIEAQAKVTSLADLFVLLDDDGSGTLTFRELEQAIKSSNDISDIFFVDLGIELEELRRIFAMLDVGEDGAVDPSEFLKGVATVMDDIKSWSCVEAAVRVKRMAVRFRDFMIQQAQATEIVEEITAQAHRLVLPDPATLQRARAAVATGAALVTSSDSPLSAMHAHNARLVEENEHLRELLREALTPSAPRVSEL
mmetsp:Transcript_17844/g.41201  ORF Transcript_17844/g.41201 Transcript_17844/m.41201 type:complete len:572 (+) Transcript_17844:57-1772(+)